MELLSNANDIVVIDLKNGEFISKVGGIFLRKDVSELKRTWLHLGNSSETVGLIIKMDFKQERTGKLVDKIKQDAEEVPTDEASADVILAHMSMFRLQTSCGYDETSQFKIKLVHRQKDGESYFMVTEDAKGKDTSWFTSEKEAADAMHRLAAKLLFKGYTLIGKPVIDERIAKYSLPAEDIKGEC